MEKEPNINANLTKEKKEREIQEKVRYGTIREVEGLGYFIIPDDAPPNTGVEIPDVDHKLPPPGFSRGDRVKFRLNKMREAVDIEKISGEEK
jgi:hypothetical protein